jgi:hypothetical protein
MAPTCRDILVTFEFFAISLLAAHPLLSQSDDPSDRQRSVYGGEGCRDIASYQAPAKPHNERTVARSFFPSGTSGERAGCIEPRAIEPAAIEAARTAHWRDAERTRVGSRAVAVAKPDSALPAGRESVLKDIGMEGTNISRARQAVLEILKDTNTCSEWFRQSDPQIADTFSSLSIAVDEDGAKHVIKERNDEGIWIEHGPYIARTWQSAGAGTTVTLNANGAFFRTTGDLYKLEWSGGMENDTGLWRHLHIGPFDGGSLQAQAIALLHELGHVIGAIPSDDASTVGFARSQENTNLILRHCQSQASTLGKRSKLLSAKANSAQR